MIKKTLSIELTVVFINIENVKISIFKKKM